MPVYQISTNDFYYLVGMTHAGEHPKHHKLLQKYVANAEMTAEELVVDIIETKFSDRIENFSEGAFLSRLNKQDFAINKEADNVLYRETHDDFAFQLVRFGMQLMAEANNQRRNSTLNLAS